MGLRRDDTCGRGMILDLTYPTLSGNLLQLKSEVCHPVYTGDHVNGPLIGSTDTPAPISTTLRADETMVVG